MVAPSVASDKPAAKSGRRRPLIIGLIMIAVASGGYLRWQHFAHSPGAAAPKPLPPVPVIATTVQRQNFPIVLTGVGNVAALNSATVPASSRNRSSASTSRTASTSKRASSWRSSIRAPIRRGSTRRRPTLPATRRISTMGGSTSAGTSRWKNKALLRNNRLRRKERKTPRSRPLSKPTRRRSSTPKPS